MPSVAAHRTHKQARSLTWPLPVHHTTNAVQHKSEPESLSAPGLLSSSPPAQPTHESFEDAINEHPEDHYLSPDRMYEYEDWADDSDDEDGDEVEWNAGITDFALYDSDRRAAQERQESVPGRWDNLVVSQASALQRSVERSRADSDSTLPRPCPPLLEDLPSLTPDNSPQLRDDFDIEAVYGRRAAPVLRSYPTIKITPPQGDDKEDYDDSSSDSDSDEYDVPISVLIERAKQRRQQTLKLERPGLRYARTLSGKVHVWRRPSHQIYPVRENAAAEAEAEAEAEAAMADSDETIKPRMLRSTTA